jgi:hypothetical protein
MNIRLHVKPIKTYRDIMNPSIMHTASITLLGAVLSTAVIAEEQYTCTGQIDLINQAYEGSVAVVSNDLFHDPQAGRTICNLNQKYHEVTPVVCQAWLSKLLAAQSRGAKITIQYVDGSGSCAQQPAWSNASAPWSIW